MRPTGKIERGRETGWGSLFEGRTEMSDGDKANFQLNCTWKHLLSEDYRQTTIKGFSHSIY